MIASDALPILRSIERKLLWLSTWMVHHANAVRPNADGTKVGGHQPSSASVASLVTALYFHWLRPGDVVAMKAHAAPLFYAAQHLRGRLDVRALSGLRSFGGLQAYPSRRKNADVVDLSTGSMGLGAVQATFGALAARYLADHGGRAVPERFVVMVGDAELDEGNVWEALLEETLAELGNVLWIVDVNRQSPDRLYRGTRAAGSWLLSLVGADEEEVPVVSALDGHSHALAFLGGALGVPQIALGVDDFGQSGTRADLHRHYGIDADALVRAARTLAGRRP